VDARTYEENRQVNAESSVLVRFEAVVPQFTVPDVVHTAEYYQNVLGFQIDGYWDGERASLDTKPLPVFGIVRRDQIQVFLSRADESPPRTGRATGAYDAYLRVRGLDTLAAELRARGAEILDGPEERSYGQRELVVRDCNGLILAFGEDIHRGATSPAHAAARAFQAKSSRSRQV
jgi:uncharacterized glyoxalase superfamily protein PhnB